MKLMEYFKSQSSILKKIKEDLVVIDRYFGTVLLCISCAILGYAILQNGCPETQNFLFLKKDTALLIYFSSIAVYCVMFFAAWVLHINMKLRMFLIISVAAVGAIRFWELCGNPGISVSNVIAIVVLIIVFYISMVLLNMEKYEYHVGNLQKLRDDIYYVPGLLDSVQSADLRKRIANEVYSYVYGAKKYKRRYYFLTSLSIILPALVTAINSSKILSDDSLSIVISVLSMLTVVVTGIMSSMKAKESWMRYRKYLECAKREIFSCVMGLEQYAALDNQTERELLLAENLEQLYGGEQDEWKIQRKDAK